MEEKSSPNQSQNIMDNNNDEEEVAISVRRRHDQSTPLPVPNATDSVIDDGVSYRRGRGRRPCPINTESGGLLLNEDGNISRSSFVSDDGDSHSRRTSVGAESGYYGSPYNTRLMSSSYGLSWPYSPSFSPSSLSVTFFTTSPSTSSSSSSPSYVHTQQRFFGNFSAVVSNQLTPPNQRSQAGDQRQIERHAVRPPEFDVEQYRAPSGANGFRSIGTQTSIFSLHVLNDDLENEDDDVGK